MAVAEKIELIETNARLKANARIDGGGMTRAAQYPNKTITYMQKNKHEYLDIWVIEDNDEMRATLVEVIDSDPGMMCSLSFARCEEALATLRKESPQVMLMDIGLPRWIQP